MQVAVSCKRKCRSAIRSETPKKAKKTKILQKHELTKDKEKRKLFKRNKKTAEDNDEVEKNYEEFYLV